MPWPAGPYRDEEPSREDGGSSAEGGVPFLDTARAWFPEPVALLGRWALPAGAGTFTLLQPELGQLLEESAGALWVQPSSPAVAPSLSSLAAAGTT